MSMQSAHASALGGAGWKAASTVLDAELRTAHAAGNEAALARLYGRAGDLAETRGDADAACFFLTQAYVFALAADADDAGALHARLVAQGREE